jgi:hypothetical protein
MAQQLKASNGIVAKSVVGSFCSAKITLGVDPEADFAHDAQWLGCARH